ncbi:MAG: tetratricopeptide repeat protein [Spirochaetaceae bacterium]|jgi:tetratricopeptide (TPR) repeat protein|nr:tetratricopeptide repeat protein [Spirochaetaceae bacterium]
MKRLTPVFRLLWWVLLPAAFFVGDGPPLHGQSGAALYYEQGRSAMAGEDWYAAVEAFLECLRLNPAHAEGTAALAECYYELGEFDQALNWVRKARTLARTNPDLANLEAFILIALGRLDGASALIAEVLAREPYNRDALFAQAELDIARGRAGDAVGRYREVARRYPDDRRVLASLALVLGSLGDTAAALSYIERALATHPADYRLSYYAAYLNARAERFPQAIRYAEQALFYHSGYGPARSLLASLWYRSGQYEEAARLAGEAIARDRSDISAWYLKGMSFIRLGRYSEAIPILSAASAIDPEDEFVRSALEETLIGSTGLEDPGRVRWAAWHFGRARDFRSRNLADQALFEYRRGLRLNPYARERGEYAELLRILGYPARYLEELRFLRDRDMGDLAINDAVEAYDALLSGALFRRWSVDPVELSRRHWKVAVFSVNSPSTFFHADAGAVASAYIRDLLIHDRNILPMDLELRQPSFSQAFRTAREAGADYFLILTTAESERDLSLGGELFVGRTGSPALTLSTFRTGADRLRNASRSIVEQLGAALPFRGELVARRAAEGLMDKGKADGVAENTVYEIVKKGRPAIRNEGIGLYYGEEDVVGALAVTRVDEEVSSGTISRNGFFDRVEAGDEIILQTPKPASPDPGASPADPELRTLLRTLR